MPNELAIGLTGDLINKSSSHRLIRNGTRSSPERSGEVPPKAVLTSLFVVNFVSIAGFGMILPVLPAYGDTIGASGTDIAWAIGAFSLGQMISGSVLGRVSDRVGRRPVILASLIVSALLYMAHIYAVQPATLILVRLLSGLASGSFALSFAVGADVSGPAERARILGLVGAGFSFGFILGPALGGFVAGVVPLDQAFSVVCFSSAAMVTLAAFVTALLLPETRRSDPGNEQAPQQGAIGLFRRPGFVFPMVILLFGSISIAMMQGTFVLFASDVLALKPLGIGFMYSLVGFIAVATQATLAGPIATWIGERRMLAPSLVIMCAGMILLGLSRSVVPATLGMAFIAIGFSLLGPAVQSLSSLAAPHAMTGTAMGIVQAAGSLGRFIGPGIAGPIYDAYGPSSPFFGGAAILVVVSVLALHWGFRAGGAGEISSRRVS